ncbi:2,3,4,5-tetrahydropyridine-2,6-carboxylate N-succinyltransferase [Malaciobacter molluscorum LMG 25693]|uniref:2,3,4,5-tetrahydropyridine-2,6-carboxylate N-succinyltransferase n=1 Tax=Malaciobacter molluscorum LMG 25693 TaxID=870501 RepID=A0A2G1DLH3_9BACT|nr:tetrahydrodipicolinate N-succinyltransferase N-terminal domain-containing protein [Malaciobacter molluscorum]AXX92093.1 tetrahydrodipicolinate succinylase [Malaciobacter molluscorum LMG 25693]PHO19321.1 2,3,4,5-tetrahydropyridine-2,6-carboxylate N-succinyltransferase [Malaciobacter molluscorum LMG 25693]
MAYTKEEFKQLVTDIQSQDWYKNPIGFGIARVDRGQLNKNKILQATYPVANWEENYGSAAIFLNALKESGVDVDTSKSELVCDLNDKFLEKCIESFRPYIPEAKGQDHKNVQVLSTLASLPIDSGLTADNFKVVFIFEDVEPKSAETVYLKLYALSLGKAKLRSLNLNGAFGKLENCAWVGNQPIELDWLRENEIALKISAKYPKIDMVDKFPRFLSHVIPADNTRILETSKVRFGAQLAGGTTVMPGAAYINFNAGTEGAVMVEGRISSSAIVGAGSDVGGGASILGVLSGTDGVPVSIGENTLLGANSCTGTAIGDSCILDAGVTILPGTKITLSEKAVEQLKEINPNKEIKTVMKGMDFLGVNGVHFRVNSQTGQTVAMRSTREVKLNADLH